MSIFRIRIPADGGRGGGIGRGGNIRGEKTGAADMCFGALGCSAGFSVHPNASAFLGCCVRLSLGGVYGGAAFLPIYSKKYTVMKYFKIFSLKSKQPIDI